MAGEDLHTSRLVQKQGLKGPALLSRTGSTLEQNTVLCEGLLFYVISSLYTGVSEPSHEVLLKGVDRDPERLCSLLPYLPSLFPAPSQRDIFKRPSPLWISFDHTILLLALPFST